ncbi:MAG: hypothetical protein WED10_05705 [Brumimicrobium sp.]
MIFQKEPYDLIYIMKEYEEDDSDHIYSYLYRFVSTDNGLTYILRAEYHKGDVFGIKFYAKPHAKSKKKYSLLTNKGYALRVLQTCGSVIPLLLKDYPMASFGLIGSRLLDEEREEIEVPQRNIRFRIYEKVAKDLFGEKTFEHYSYSKISGYLLINKRNNIEQAKEEIERMFIHNYRDIHNYEDLI